MTNGDHVDIYSKTFAGDLSEGCLHALAMILNADADFETAMRRAEEAVHRRTGYRVELEEKPLYAGEV